MQKVQATGIDLIQKSASSPRVRVPIALKLTLGSTALVLLVVSVFAALSMIVSQQQAERQKNQLQRSEVESLRRVGLTTAKGLAESAAAPLLEGDLPLVEEALSKLVRSDSEMLEGLYIDSDGRLISRGSDPSTKDLKLEAKFDVLKAPTVLEPPLHLHSENSFSYAAPIYVGDRHYGTIVVELSTERMQEALVAIDVQAAKDRRAALLWALVLGLGSIVIGGVISILQGYFFTKPIRTLVDVTEEIRQGNLEARADKTTNDEIGVLCDRFNVMTEQISVLVEETAEKASLERELDLAKNIQTSLMPPREVIQANGIEYFGYCESADRCGGDWWNHYRLEDGRTVLCIGDVTGHGVSSALLTASAKACCDTVMAERVEFSLEKLMSTLDHVIREAGKQEYVMTFFAAVIDPFSGVVHFANAGHNFPMVVRGGKVSALVARGGRLGDGTEFQVAQKELEPNDLLVFYTDGLIECASPQNEEYGMRRFKKYVRKNAEDNVDQLIDGLVDEAYRFYDTQARDDDITLLMCRFKGAAEKVA